MGTYNTEDKDENREQGKITDIHLVKWGSVIFVLVIYLYLILKILFIE